MDKIRILYIIPRIGLGGCEKQLLELCRRLNKIKFDITLLWYSQSSDTNEEEFIAAGINTIFFDKLSMPPWKFFWKLRKTIKNISPDIVHTWLDSANFWGRCAAITCRTPHIITSFRVEVRDDQEKYVIFRIAEKFLSQKSLILANSNAVAQSLEKIYGIPQQRVTIIYNAVNCTPCDRLAARSEIRHELGLPSEQKIILMVARQAKQKNYPMFIKVAKNICQQCSDVIFVSVGRGDMMDELNTLAETLGVIGKIKFIGLRNDVHRWLAASDIFCFTSNYEGFPNAILEAMMAGLPVVSTNFPGVEELITNSQTGILVPLNDDILMAKEILRLLENPDVRRNLGASGKASVEINYTWDLLIDKMESLYLNLTKVDSTTGLKVTS